MVDFVYRSQPAIDQDGMLANVGEGNVFAIDDTAYTTPLTVTKAGEVTSTIIRVSQISLTETFTVADHPELWWKSGDLVVHLASFTGMVDTMEQMRAAIETTVANYTGLVDAALADLIADPTSLTHAAVAAMIGSGGGGDANMADLYAVRRWTAEDGWPLAERGTYGGIIWLGPSLPAPPERAEHDIRIMPVEG